MNPPKHETQGAENVIPTGNCANDPEPARGRVFTTFTGASRLIALPEKEGVLGGLTFRVPGYLTNEGVNRVTVELTPADLYRVRFERQRGGVLKQIAEHDGVYAEDLQDVFEKASGLLVHP